jgi:hypothetical protein
MATAIHSKKTTKVDIKFSTIDAVQHWKFFKAWLVLKDLPSMALPFVAPDATGQQ